MNPVEVSHISKSFGLTKAVVDVSFEVKQGEIFGLLGPNGAGKTTAIRIMLDIFKPDSGKVSILGGIMNDEKKARIGYMPEERGLYQDVPLERCLLYLASLKGVTDSDSRNRLGEYLDRFDLTDHKGKKVKELSKGMQQKAQIITTLLHEPDLVVIDEPFTSLDPLNVQLVKDLMTELRQDGVTIIMSTHQMHQVEELCDRILLIDKGKNVLYGNLEEVRNRFSGHEVIVRSKNSLPSLPGVEYVGFQNGSVKLTLAEDTSPQEILRELTSQDVILEKFEIAIPSLDEIFIRVVEGGREQV
jgi:ABC-2 type transport system ATP-binding protein